MELSVLDPFGDYQTAGYLRNIYQEKDLRVVGHLETAAFEQEILPTVRFLRRLPSLRYEHITDTHHRLFSSLYPWAGEDRHVNAPNLKIIKAGYKELFALPSEVQRSAEYALLLGQDKAYLQTHPGEVFAYLAYAHPFLEGNGRTILTVFAELSRRAGFHVEWDAIDKDEFLKTLTHELLNPSKSILDTLVLRYTRKGVLSAYTTARRLRVNFKRNQNEPASGSDN